jgi:hypothetical protein
MSGPTEPSPSHGGRLGPIARFLGRLRGGRRRDAVASDSLFQDLNRLSIRYAECFANHDEMMARKAADELLRTSSSLINRLPRWWMAETTPAFTAVSDDGVVYASEPTWPKELWPQAHQIWVRANGIAILAKQYVGTGPRFFLSYQVVSIQAELQAFLDRVNKQQTIQFDEEAKRLRGALAQARTDFQTGAVTTARFAYLSGVGAGLLLVAPLSLVLLIRQSSESGSDNLVFDAAACAIAGAAGALVSVLTRVTNESLHLDFHVGPRMLVVLGLARPILGSILALALYWATVGEVVPLAPPGAPDARYAFFIAIGFIAGFSERYAQDMLLIRTQPQPAPESTTTRTKPGESAPSPADQPAGA